MYKRTKNTGISIFLFLLSLTGFSQHRLFLNTQTGVSQNIIRYTLSADKKDISDNYFENNIVNKFQIEFFVKKSIFLQSGLAYNSYNYTSAGLKDFQLKQNPVNFEIPFMLNKIFLLRNYEKGRLLINFSIGLSYLRRQEYFLNQRFTLSYLLTRSNSGLEYQFKKAGRAGIYAGWGQKTDYNKKIILCESGDCAPYKLSFNDKYFTLFLSYSLPIGLFFNQSKIAHKKGLGDILFLPADK